MDSPRTGKICSVVANAICIHLLRSAFSAVRDAYCPAFSLAPLLELTSPWRVCAVTIDWNLRSEQEPDCDDGVEVMQPQEEVGMNGNIGLPKKRRARSQAACISHAIPMNRYDRRPV
jgi:hypothetical protein